MKINLKKIQLVVAIAFLASLAGISQGAEVLWWSGEMTAGVFDDASGNGNTGEAYGAATNAPGLVGDAIYLDGSNNAFVQNWGCSGLPTLTANAWSMNAYINLDVICPNWGQVYNFGSGNYDTANRGLIGYNVTDGQDVRFVTSNAGANQLWTGVMWTTNEWHMYTVVCDGTNVQFYYDGWQTGVTKTRDVDGFTMTNGSQYAMVGRSGWGQNIEGLVDEFTIWDNRLSQTEIDVLVEALIPEPTTMLIIISFVFAFFLRRNQNII